MTNVILWDWDNTLIDSFEAIFAAQNDVRQYFGMPKWTKEEAKLAMNKSGKSLLNDVFGSEKLEEARHYYLNAYATHAAELQLMPGALDALKDSKNHHLFNILASNKKGEILRNEAKLLGVDIFFDRIIGAEDFDCSKPSKEFTDVAIKDLDVNYIVSIGDGSSDIQMARNYKEGIGILIGTDPHLPEFEQTKPDLVFKDLSTMVAFSKKNEDLNKLLSTARL